MNSVKILVGSDQAVRDFSRRISKYDCEFDVQVGKEYMDARSLAGLFSLSLNKPLTLHIYAEDDVAEQVREDLDEYCMAQNGTMPTVDLGG